MRFNKVYIPKDAIAKREDFDVWYQDGALSFSVSRDWSKESNHTFIEGRLGGEIARIKPDNNALTYYLRIGRWEYTMRPTWIFEQYSIEGMLWRIDSGLEDAPFDILRYVSAEDVVKDGRVRLVNFMNHGPCYEVMVKDVSYLRIAAISIIAIALKEEYKGLSEGDSNKKTNAFSRFMNWMSPKGLTYEQVQAIRANPEEAE